jgi:hypothetical protein
MRAHQEAQAASASQMGQFRQGYTAAMRSTVDHSAASPPTIFSSPNPYLPAAPFYHHYGHPASHHHLHQQQYYPPPVPGQVYMNNPTSSQTHFPTSYSSQGLLANVISTPFGASGYSGGLFGQTRAGPPGPSVPGNTYMSPLSFASAIDQTPSDQPRHSPSFFFGQHNQGGSGR